MKLYLYRICTRRHTTDGVLQDEQGLCICDTAEHTPHMLPEGTYQLTLERHKKLGHRAPCIQQGNATAAETSATTTADTVTTADTATTADAVTTATAATSWIIHGNGIYGKDFGASIVIGDCLVPGVVIRSYPYFERLVKRLEKVFQRNESVELIITSS